MADGLMKNKFFKHNLPQTRTLLSVLFSLAILSLIYILIGSFRGWPFIDFALALFSSLIVATATVFDSNINRSEVLISAEVSKIDDYNFLIDALFARLSLIRGEYTAIYEAIQIKKESPTRSFIALFLHHNYYTRDVAPIEVSKFGFLPDDVGESSDNSQEINFKSKSIYFDLHSLLYDVNVVLDFIVIVDQLTEKLRNRILNDKDEGMYIENETMEQIVENTRFSTCIEQILERVPELEKRLVELITRLSDSAPKIFSQTALKRRCVINPLEHIAKVGEYKYCELISPSSIDIHEALMKEHGKDRIFF